MSVLVSVWTVLGCFGAVLVSFWVVLVSLGLLSGGLTGLGLFSVSLGLLLSRVGQFKSFLGRF